MSPHSGRLEKRMNLAVRLELLGLNEPRSMELAETENVCSGGARVLTGKPADPGERLLVRFLEFNLQTEARVVYCQQLADKWFGVGLQFERMIGAWSQARKKVERVF